jgi:hydroxymethylglutaryl-CoA lyase
MKIIECPRDAMQGIKEFIPSDEKARYINQLLKVGFDTLDFGSFVSPKAIPQMRDTAAVLSKLDLNNDSSKLLSIVANLRGAQDACEFDEISYLGFPFSISETFQQRNTNSSIRESLTRLADIQNLALKHNKKVVAYLSMGFGNPYDEEWSTYIVAHWAEALIQLDIKILALSDTIGVSNPENINYLFSNLIPEFPQIEFGAHLHTTPDTWQEKVQAAYDSGCRRFDGALKGYGGCPMAKDELVGNMPTEKLLEFMQTNNVDHGLSETAFAASFKIADQIFPT